VDVEVVIVLGVGDCRLETFLYVMSDALARKFEIGERLRNLLAADELCQQVQLLRAHAQHAGHRLGFVVGERTLTALLAHDASPRLTTRRRPVPEPQPRRRPRQARLWTAWPCDRTNVRRTSASGRIPRICGRPFPR